MSGEERSTQVDQAPTLGEMADVMRDWQARGITLASVRYATTKVFHKEIDAEYEHATEAIRALRSEVRTAIRDGVRDKHSPDL